MPSRRSRARRPRRRTRRTRRPRRPRRRTRRTRRTRRIGLGGIVRIDKVLPACKNKQHGCDWEASRYNCFKYVKTQKRRDHPDKQILTNRRGGRHTITHRLRPRVVNVDGTFWDCSSFGK
jgi:hypothetical protein